MYPKLIVNMDKLKANIDACDVGAFLGAGGDLVHESLGGLQSP